MLKNKQELDKEEEHGDVSGKMAAGKRAQKQEIR